MITVIFSATILATTLLSVSQGAVAQGKAAASPTTLTGCLQTTDEKNEYTIKTGDGMDYRLFGTETANLAPHVGTR